MNEIKVNEHILDDDKYLLIFSVEEVNRLVREGIDVYKRQAVRVPTMMALCSARFLCTSMDVRGVDRMTGCHPHGSYRCIYRQTPPISG